MAKLFIVLISAILLCINITSAQLGSSLSGTHNNNTQNNVGDDKNATATTTPTPINGTATTPAPINGTATTPAPTNETATTPAPKNGTATTPMDLCTFTQMPSITTTAPINSSDPCSKCYSQCPYGVNRTASPTCTECKCMPDPCIGVNCFSVRKCQAVAIDICGDVPCANTTYLGVCVRLDNPCPAPCLHFCDFGFVMGSDGCPTCACAHPCKNFTCEFGKKCKEVANTYCNGLPCPNSTYSATCDFCPTCNKFCPFGNYVASDGCPSCDCLEPCRGSTCQPGQRCREKASIMCGIEPCANASYYPECIPNVCPTCNNVCPYGYNMDSYGCPTCECKDPCKGIRCDDDWECKPVANNMCGNTTCANSTYSATCAAPVLKARTCSKACPYGNVIGADGYATCVCIEPCMNVPCPSGQQCIADMRPICGTTPCANATYVGVCASSSQAANQTYISSTEVFEDPLRDVTHLKQEALVCAGNTETLSCPEGQTVSVIRAFFGRNSSTACLQGTEGSAANLRYSLPDATAVVTDLCDNEQECDVSPNMEEFGNPVAPVSLYLKVEYLCQPRIHKTLQCSNTGRMELECAAGTTLNIVSAFYGRDDMNTTCPHRFALTANNCSNPKAFDTVREICNGRQSCFVGADDKYFDDPCPHTNKYLRMEYQCMGCVNLGGDDAKCQMWANQGYCETNRDWMMYNCRKACTRCEQKLECVNEEDDADCDTWASRNECINNPSYMYAYCRKSCLKCNQKSGCTNLYDQYNNTACNIWMNANQCSENSKFMIPYCTKSCFNCDKNIRCGNNYPDDKCDGWAMMGECDKNPGFMVSQCYKSCFNCDKDPVCENTGASDSQCDQWAKQDDCVNNPSFMYRYCWKSCLQCQSTGLPSCYNYWGDVWCEQLALQGQCMASGVLNVCYKSCSRCSTTPSVSDCINTNDTMCAEFARAGKCLSDPVTGASLCKRTCTMCDQPTLQTAYYGGGLMPGEVLSTLAGQTVVADVIPVRARLAYFSAFFVSNTSFYVQIWRPWGPDNFYRVFNQYVTPTNTNLAQTIPIEGGCVQTSAGDRIGFTTMQGPPPMATSFDPSRATNKVYLRAGNKEDKFTIAGFSVRFSLNAHTIPGQC